MFRRVLTSKCFNTQPPEGGCRRLLGVSEVTKVSTHSRPKAAARPGTHATGETTCFNTQPPEGGCAAYRPRAMWAMMFQHTAARRRLRWSDNQSHKQKTVSTHSRPKAAACCFARQYGRDHIVSTHSRPKAAADGRVYQPAHRAVSTHSRPKAAAFEKLLAQAETMVSTHSRPKAAAFDLIAGVFAVKVSTHSRPKAAA